MNEKKPKHTNQSSVSFLMQLGADEYFSKIKNFKEKFMKKFQTLNTDIKMQ